MSVSIAHPTNRPNFTRVSIGNLTLWYSYETVIGFQTTGNRVVSENVWGNTTGRHLNEISDRSDRIPRDRFIRELADVLTTHGL